MVALSAISRKLPPVQACIKTYVCETHDDALDVSFTTPSVNGAFEIQINDRVVELRVTDTFALAWGGLVGNNWLKSVTYFATCCSFSTISSTSWAVERKVWTISKNEEISAEYPQLDGSTERLQPFVDIRSNLLCWLRPSRPDTHGWSSVKIVFEG